MSREKSSLDIINKFFQNDKGSSLIDTSEKEGGSFHSGFIAVMGKPNVGKSTLVNSLVGQKIAIVSSKPQTTRHRILGVRNAEDSQMVFVDTPGVHKPSHELGKYMEKTYKSEFAEADLCLFLVDITHEPTSEDFRAGDIIAKGENRIPVFLVINKIDRVGRERIDKNKEKMLALGNFADVFEISALKGSGLEVLVERITELLPEGPPYFPSEMKSDQSQELIVSEVVREKILRKTRQEIPHSVFVYTETVREGGKEGDLYCSATVYVERKSQRGIIIGKGGEMLKKIGMMAREDLEVIFGKKVYLDLWVKVKEDWKDRRDLLKSWGYEV